MDREDRSIDMALVVLRLTLGVVMIAHGLQKVGVVEGGAASLGNQIEIFGKMGIPEWLGYLSIAAELLGGLGVLLGLFGRVAAFGIAVNLFVAIAKVHVDKGLFAQGGGFELPLALFTMALALLFTGMGQYSVDAVMAKTMDKSIGTGGRF